MDTGLKVINGLICTALVAVLSVQMPAFAKRASTAADKNGKQRYIVILDDPPLTAYDGRILPTPERFGESTRLSATANRFTGASKLDVKSPVSQQYLEFLDERFESFRGDALLRLGRLLNPVHRYRNALNGFATELTVSEAEALREIPRVRSVVVDEIQHLQTDSGPNWIGADIIHNGNAGVPATGGEGVVIGFFDTGINWDHPSFSDPGEGLPPGSGGWDHINPYDTQLGLCSKSEVLCNDKLVGVFDFVEDEPDTVEIEEKNNGKDNADHGSLVASIIAGNPTNVTLNGFPAQIGGVAPNANIISYRVCYIGDISDPDDDACQTSAILRAIDQAIIDGVDIINHSVGGEAFDPWSPGSSNFEFLQLRTAGIFVATSNGNGGPDASSIGSPANAPWITSAGGATHDRLMASVLENLSGGNTTPPGTLVGLSTTDGVGIRKIVHAKDYGNALCGTGESEGTIEWTCDDYNGVNTNPFAPGTFNGEIVVCDRGEYGRIEKGKNLLMAGAGGYVLANTESSFQTLYRDDLCLPATHIGLEDGNKLRSWLDSGIGHQGSISGFGIFHIPEAGDIVAYFNSRGPGVSPTEDLMKPDVITPGVDILGASSEADNYVFYSGSSFSSPHLAGGAALIKSAHPDWTPTMIASAIVMTATPELAIDYDDSIATVHKRGAGRPRLDQAVNAGLYLDETTNNFIGANPSFGGEPKNLNLPGLVDAACSNDCSFQRTVTDLAGGASWEASVEGLIDGVDVSVTPNNFSLANGASQELTVSVDLTQVDLVGQWIYGQVRLTSNGLPDAVFPLAVLADGGELPSVWNIFSDSISGWKEFALDDLANMPDATFQSGGLVVPTETTEDLPEDPGCDPWDDQSEGLMTVWHNVPAETLWLHAKTLSSSTSTDVDLYVGRDTNGDGKARESEELCGSYSPGKVEVCDLFTPVPGDYWIIAQNCRANRDLDEVTLKSAVVGKNTTSLLSASGNGIVPSGELQEVRLSWDNVSAVPGTELMGAVGIGTSRDNPNNMGIIPVNFTKTGVPNPETLVLMNGVRRGLSISGNGSHDRIVVDIPPATESFTISTSATGAHGEQNTTLQMELYRTDFGDAFTDAPFAATPDTSGDPIATATGTSDNGPSLTISGSEAVAGRWYVVLKNASGADADIGIRADMVFSGAAFPLRAGLWQPVSRPGISQGYDYASTGDYRAFLWYTYDEEGRPAWYLAAGPEPQGNVWVAELLRYTNDGTIQQETAVGYVSVTTLAEQDSVFSFVLFGEDGSDRLVPTSPPECPTVNDVEMSYTGLWSREAVGVGGTSVLVNVGTQGYLHYIYDDRGRPVWLLGANVNDSLPNIQEMSLLQYDGYCAVCSGTEPTTKEVGLFTGDYADELNATWNLNYVLEAPLSGSVDRTDETMKLTVPLVCQ